jgi:hypothetical protein
MPQSRNALQNGHVLQPAALPAASVSSAPAVEAEEVEVLRGENAGLHARVEELEQLLATTTQETEERWIQRQAEYEALLDEKSEVIRSLHQKMADLREQLSTGGQAANAKVQAADCDDLMQIRRELEEQRRQLGEDEESMMSQLRQMEMALARDRAELARQRAEVQRLHNEMKHDMETAARDGGLRERLQTLQRRGAPATPPTRPSVSQDTPLPLSKTPPAPEAKDGSAPKGGTGIFRRLFGSGQ